MFTRNRDVILLGTLSFSRIRPDLFIIFITSYFASGEA